MIINAWYSYFVCMFPNEYMQILFVLTLSGILTWAFLKKLLNPIIDAALAILGCAIETILTFLMIPVGWTANRIEKHITVPVHNVTKRIHIPAIIKALVWALAAGIVLYMDQKYGKSWFTSDETFAMYPITVDETKFWVSELALWSGGFCLFLSAIYILDVVIAAFNAVFDRTIQLDIAFYL